MDSCGEEVSQWEAMLSSPGEWAECEHCLRPSIQDVGGVETGGVGTAAGDVRSSDVGTDPVTQEQEGTSAEDPTAQHSPDTTAEDQTTPSMHQEPNHSVSSNPHMSISSLPLASFDSDEEDNDLEV